jgi:hypothetical protein
MTEISDLGLVPPLNVVVIIVGAVIAGVGVVGVAAPLLLLDLGRSLLSTNGLYAVAALRVAFGLLLLWVASRSRMLKTLRVIGAVILINGAVTPLFGVERSEALLSWFSNRGPAFVRIVATLAIAFGAFVVYVVSPRRRLVV